jgi:hypothetical protein
LLDGGSGTLPPLVTEGKMWSSPLVICERHHPTVANCSTLSEAVSIPKLFQILGGSTG